MQILVTPEQLVQLSQQMKMAAADLETLGARLWHAYCQLDWESSERATVEGQVRQARARSQAMSEKAYAFGSFLTKKAEAFEKADGQYQSPPDTSFQWSFQSIVVIGDIFLAGSFFGPLGGVFGLAWAYKAYAEWELDNFRAIDPIKSQQIIEEKVNLTEAGRAALNKAKAMGVRVSFIEGAGTFYDPDSDPPTIYIDKTNNKDMAAESFMHEVTHAVQDQEGRLPDAEKLSREDYLEKNFAMEAEAIAAEIKEENQRGPVYSMIPRFEPRDSMKLAYSTSHDAKLLELSLTRWDLSSAERERMADLAGQESIVQFYRDGKVRTSTTGQTYNEYCGEFWDSQHQKI